MAQVTYSYIIVVSQIIISWEVHICQCYFCVACDNMPEIMLEIVAQNVRIERLFTFIYANERVDEYVQVIHWVSSLQYSLI